MGDCNLSLSYNSSENQEKFCKYSYSSWCSTCEKTSPRRRSRSETESCKKKCKEMKTLTPKKYNKCTEYENMELEYDYKGWHETKYDCCSRVRPNLVELPTTYISNNCQITANLMNIPKSDSDLKQIDCPLKSVNGKTSNNCQIENNLMNFAKCDGDMRPLDCPLKCVNVKNPISCSKSYNDTKQHSLKFVDLNKHLQSFDAAPEIQRVVSDKITPVNFDPIIKPLPCYNSCNDLVFTKSKSPVRDNHESDHANLRFRSNCREYCPLVEFKYHELLDRNSVCYNTSTYFDQQAMATSCAPDIQHLKDQLMLLRRSSYDKSKGDGVRSRPSLVDSSMDINVVLDDHLEAEKSEKKVFSRQPSKMKLGVKTKRAACSRIRKQKLKSSSIPPAESIDSDCGESDSDVVDDEPVEEEPESISSEHSSDDSAKDSTDTTGSNGTNYEFGSGDIFGWPVRPSLFPNIPPYIKFHSHDALLPRQVPSGSRKYFKWKLSTITPIIVRKTLTNSGFALVRKSNQWLGTWGKHMKSPMFKTLKDMQKLNHFPGTFQLGRKDRLWKNFQRMINKFGLKEFGFLPHCYILPHELKTLKQNWEFKTSAKEMWIIKPPASARGVGIKVINKWSQLPKKTSLVVQKYISNPYLINGSKFDLRLYVLVTSFHPLRIYLWPDGLARFASAKYSDDAKDLKDRYMHLTNYSINKLSSQYTANEDANACLGHKWTISKLMEFLALDGVDTKSLWKSLQELVIKTIVASEALITPLCEEHINSLYNCYELFGVDVLLDENLKPWLLEVNISPSLHSSSPLDAHVKGPLVQTLFDMAQFHFPTRLSQFPRQTPPLFDPKMYVTSLTKKERHKHNTFTQYEDRDLYVYDILKDLTGDDVRHLARAEDEYAAKGMFEKIFPTAYTHKYMDFMEIRYYNRLFDAWEARYATRRDDGVALLQTLCAQRVHLKTGPHSMIAKSLPNTILGVVDHRPIQPSQKGHSRPLEDIMQETSLRNNLSTSSDDI